MDELKTARIVSLTCVEPRSVRFAIIVRLPSQASAAQSSAPTGHAAADNPADLRYASHRVSIAQSARAVLCATAVAAMFTGRRLTSAASQGRTVTPLRNVVPTTALAPWISNVRR